MLALQPSFVLSLNPENILDDIVHNIKKRMTSIKLNLEIKFLIFVFESMVSYYSKRSDYYSMLLDNNDINSMKKINIDKEYNMAYDFNFLYDSYDVLKRKKGKNTNFDTLLNVLDTFIDVHAKNMNYLGMIESRLISVA